MIVVELSGGMGNQMFQYAFGRYLALKHNTELLLDTHYLLDRNPNRKVVFRDYDLTIFNIKATIAPKEISREFGYLRSKVIKAKQKIFPPKKLKIVTENNLEFLEMFETLPDNIYLKGYWQNFRYFKSVEEIIRQDFSFKEKLSNNCKLLLDHINTTNSVCLNVRRADFVNNNTHRTLEVSYYRKGEKEIEEKVDNPVFFVFSDDIEWCKKNIKPNHPTVFVEHKYAGEKFRDYLYLMSKCKHYIIPNSSFALWASWLSEYENKIVVAPKIWLYKPLVRTEDIFDKNWKLINS